MDCKSTVDSFDNDTRQDRPKTKSPSRRRRDTARAKNFFARLHDRLQHQKITNRYSTDTYSVPPPHTPSHQTLATKTQDTPDPDNNETTPTNSQTTDGKQIYQDFELMLKLSRVEEEQSLTTALRHLVRHRHTKGTLITFPTPEAVDRIQLRANNLPTDIDKLEDLLHKTFIRREETLDIKKLYKDFVMTHGRLTYDMTKKWPESHIHTRHP